MKVEVLEKDGGVTYFPYASARRVDVEADELVITVAVGHLDHETRFSLDKVSSWHVEFEPGEEPQNA